MSACTSQTQVLSERPRDTEIVAQNIGEAQDQSMALKAHTNDGFATSEARIESSQTSHEEADSKAAEQEQQAEQDRLAKAVAAARFPVAWLAISAEGIPAQTPLHLLYTPDFNIEPHIEGIPAEEDVAHAIWETWGITESSYALVEYEDVVAEVDPAIVLVNLPDVLPNAVYDIVYSYNTTSRCAGQDIPGVTGRRLEGYVEGRQANPYLNCDQFVVPCAYYTFLRALPAINELEAQGWRLLVYDIYRPMTAQYYLSDSFAAAYANNTTMQASMGAWSLDWYVASGSSGHNYGTDLDIGLCDMDGTPIAMPSMFDAFDEAGHLTAGPMDNSQINPSFYCEAVATNEACLALHRAFVNAGFSEVASEWWHFGDLATEASMRSLVGNGGMDFVAAMPDPSLE